MNSGKGGLPSAPLMDHEVIAASPAPPLYDETLGLSGGNPRGQQYPPQPTHPPHQPYPLEQQHPAHLPYPQQPYYGGPGFVTPQGHAQPASSPPVPLQNVIVPSVNVQYVPVGPVAVGPMPMTTVCPACRVNVKTSTVSENKSKAHIACVLLCLLGCCFCSCIPYCMDSCKKVRHTCPNCGNYLGTYTA